MRHPRHVGFHHRARDGIGFSIGAIRQLTADSYQGHRVGFGERDPTLADLIGIILRVQTVANHTGNGRRVRSPRDEFLDLGPRLLTFRLGRQCVLRRGFLLQASQTQFSPERFSQSLGVGLWNPIIVHDGLGHPALHLGAQQPQNRGQSLGRGWRLRRRRNQMAHKLGHDLIQLGHSLATQPQHVLERFPGPAALPDVVHDHEPVVRVDDKCRQRLDLLDQLLIQGCLGPGDSQLLHQSRQALREYHVRRFRVLMLIIVEQFDNKRQPLEGVLLCPRLVCMGFAPLNLLVKSLQVRSFAW